MPTINMRSSANLVKGQGVGSCYDEQVRLVTTGLRDDYKIYINKYKSCDIAHYHTVNPNFYIERIFNRKQTSGIGYVHFLPDTLDDSLELPKIAKVVFYKYLLNFYNSMDFLVTVNPQIIKKLEQYGITRPKLIYIPNYVSNSEFARDDQNVDETKEKYNIPKDKFIVMGAGQLQTRKGIFDFVHTAELLPDVQFVWAGGFSFGKITDGYEQIKKLTENPPANVKFLGMIDRSEMPDIYNMADLFFLPSFDELFPMTILEAMCCSKPVLLRDIDIYKDILFDSYLKASNPKGFADKINELSGSKKLLDEWRQKSWDCHNIYSEESVLKKWRDLYDEAYSQVARRNKSIFYKIGGFMTKPHNRSEREHVD